MDEAEKTLENAESFVKEVKKILSEKMGSGMSLNISITQHS